MKRIATIFLSFVLVPFLTFAASWSDLLNDKRYEKVYSDSYATYYVDLYSIKSLKYNPPHYTLQADEYVVTIEQPVIMKKTLYIDYDYNRSVEKIMNYFVERNVQYSQGFSGDDLVKELMRDSGMIANSSYEELYTLNGDYILTVPSKLKNHKVENMSPLSFAADCMFYKYYNRHIFILPWFEKK